ncbi:hypothetical protein [Crossiella cryophila]|uniref:Uncharacterized protein n=1 Tax=Crossiella cryophila TaxID=43355 RepID=A0A7W7C9P8_9PSEU|nr:hypothetical protein [Crossiella cryophila]MBB4677144.1 hypothetical protein [Crossiella cryophila]
MDLQTGSSFSRPNNIRTTLDFALALYLTFVPLLGFPPGYATEVSAARRRGLDRPSSG